MNNCHGQVTPRPKVVRLSQHIVDMLDSISIMSDCYSVQVKSYKYIQKVLQR